MNINLKSIFLILAITLIPTISAKRVPPIPVRPVTINNIRFEAPITRMGIVEAYTANKKLWEQSVYKINYIPNLEKDIQDIYITKLENFMGILKITNEKGDIFELNPATRENIYIYNRWKLKYIITH